jgi:hypothetical protein
MQKSLRLAVFFPVLFAVSQFLWGKIPIDVIPNQIRTIVNDLTGPAFLMAVVISFSCLLLWRIPLFCAGVRFLFGTNICIQGTWKGTLHYCYNDEEKSKTAYLIIKQEDAFSVTIWLLTDERTSISRTASIIPYNGIQRIIYEYGVEDSSENKEKNPLHTGFCVLDISSSGWKKKLNGMYYTSRYTVGKMEFSQRKQKTVMDYQLAEELFT